MHQRESFPWKSERRLAAQSPLGSPQKFNLDLSGSIEDAYIPGLRFPEPPTTLAPIRSAAGARSKGGSHRHPDSTRWLFWWIVQGLIILILALLVIGLLCFGYRVQTNVDYYASLALPMMGHMSMHADSIMEHTDTSSRSLEHVMANADAMTSASLPQLLQAVNHTTAMVSRLERVISHPSIRLSME